MFDGLGNLHFLRHHTQAFDQSPMFKAYLDEERKLFASVKNVPSSAITRNENIIRSHTF